MRKGCRGVAEPGKQQILLESGTNELEIVEFEIGGQKFGINVIKVREVVDDLKPTKLPESHHCAKGVIQLRGQVIPLVDLGQYLGFGPVPQGSKPKIIVAEFNQTKVAFLVHSVARIHRISWEQMEKPPEIGGQQGKSKGVTTGVTTGVVKMDDRLILLLDFEKVMYDINPDLIREIQHPCSRQKRLYKSRTKTYCDC